MRLGTGTLPTTDLTSKFAHWLLKLGSGNLQTHNTEAVNLIYSKVILYSPADRSYGGIIHWLFEDLISVMQLGDCAVIAQYYASRALITPLNITVDAVNDFVTNLLPGEPVICNSIDAPDDSFLEAFNPEQLN